MHPEHSADGLLDVLSSSLQEILGSDLVAIYLYGSYVSGGFDEGVSDLDLLAVTSPEVDRLDFPGLDHIHGGIASRYLEWTDRLEIVYVGRATLGSFRTSLGRLAVMSPGEPFDVRPERAAEWLQNWYLVRETGVAIHGPPAASIVPPIEATEFVAAVVRYAIQIADRVSVGSSARSLAYAVLTLCRATMTAETRTPGSKQTGAAWTRQRMPEWGWLIDAALRYRISRGTVEFEDDRTRAAAAAFISLLAMSLRRQDVGRPTSVVRTAAKAARRSSRPS